MLIRRARNIIFLQDVTRSKSNASTDLVSANKYFFTCFSTGVDSLLLPRNLDNSKRKPSVRSINELKREARLMKRERHKVQEISLQPPDNGLLVKHLVPIARRVYELRVELHSSVAKIVKNTTIHSCSVCGEVHIGKQPHKIRTCNFAGSPANKEHCWKPGGLEHILPIVESFHLYDRAGRAVSHNERLEVDRVPAIVELCIQAGLDIPEYPTRRRTVPVYSLSGRIIDFEKKFPKDESVEKDINTFGFWSRKNRCSEDKKMIYSHSDSLQTTAVRGMEAWENMRSGVEKLMKTYAVQTCGYCSEVNVGPKGHRVRNCQAYKHQMRDGQHAWQEATIDDLIPPVYVWHSRNDEPMVDRLKRYYGRLPAVVELFAQCCVPMSDHYSSMMRDDIALPDFHEEKLVV